VKASRLAELVMPDDDVDDGPHLSQVRREVELGILCGVNGS
jgi:hypothetical protein